MKENSIGDRIEEKYTRYINCETDILELTIEEAIFILEKNASVHYVEDLLQEAYKVILLDYKRVLKENNILEKQIEYDKTHIYTPQTIESNFISKSKIKDNIEEINKRIDYIKTELTKLYIENETSTETEIDSNEYYIYNLEKEEELRYSQKIILQQLLKESEGK